MKRCALIVILSACAASKPATQRVNYPSGGPHYEYELKNGLPHGTGRVWHTNGELKSEGEYVNGVKHGTFRFYADDGNFERQAFYWRSVEVWTSTSPSDRPPSELVQGLMAYAGSDPPQLGEASPVPESETSPRFRISGDPPAPYFATLDRTTGLSRVALQYGFGDAGGDMPFGAVTRGELYGNYRVGALGGYGQLSQANYDAGAGMQLRGRRTLELGGTFHRMLDGIGALAARAGLMVPIAHDDARGYISSSASAYQRPTDAANSFPSTVALRTGTSLTRGHRYLVLQGDAGIDWLFGGPNASVDGVVRANAGAGLGVRSALVTVELSNAMRVSDPSRRLHALGVAGTFWINRMWLMTAVTISVEGHSAFTGGVGYEL